MSDRPLLSSGKVTRLRCQVYGVATHSSHAGLPASQNHILGTMYKEYHALLSNLVLYRYEALDMEYGIYDVRIHKEYVFSLMGRVRAVLDWTGLDWVLLLYTHA